LKGERIQEFVEEQNSLLASAARDEMGTREGRRPKKIRAP